MLGAPNDQGLIRSAINRMFDLVEASTEKQFLLRVSYMEIYNENVTDLLVVVSYTLLSVLHNS